MFVVFHHARNPQAWLYDPLAFFAAGTGGVDIFFVISGFIMYSAARHETVMDFLRRRSIRIAPLYWLATLVTLAYAIVVQHAPLSRSLAVHIAQSAVFLPHFSFQHPGRIWPYLAQGWTLQFEAFFYVVFAAGLVSRRLVPTVTVLLVFLVAIGLALRPQAAAAITVTDPILLEFLAGLLIARWVERLTPPKAAWLLPFGFVALALSDVTSAPRILSQGAPAALIVIGAVALERSGRLPRLRFLQRVGDASYSIYLFQVIAVDVAGRVVLRLPIEGGPQLMLMITLVMTLAIALGLAVHLWVERPMLRRLSRPAGRPAAVAV